MSTRIVRRTAAGSLIAAAMLMVVALATHTVSLLTTRGVSMLPRFHSGDLAIIVASRSYHVGEVVGYHSPLLHITVLHRIVADNNGVFTFKGDNNHFLDPTKVTASSVVGRLWWRVPHGGMVLGWIRSPAGLALLAFLFVASGVTVVRTRRRPPTTARPKGLSGRRAATRPGATSGRHFAQANSSAGDRPAGRGSHQLVADDGGLSARSVPDSAGPAPNPARGTSRLDVPEPWSLVAVPALVLALSLLLGLGAWNRPTRQLSKTSVGYTQHVAFSYSAAAAADTTYPAGRVTTGDPIFLHLVHRLDVKAAYQLTGSTGPVPNSVSGTISASVYLEGMAGWTATLAQTRAEPFGGTTASIDVPVDLDRITQLATAFDRETGIPLTDPNLVVVATVRATGQLSGQALHGSFAPSFEMQESGGQISLVSAPAVEGATSYPQLDASKPGTVSHAVTVPAHAALLGHRIGVGTERYLVLGLAIAGLLGLAAGTSVIVLRRRAGDRARIRARYKADLVGISNSPATPERPLIEVTSIGFLGRLADRYDCAILELEHELGTTYYVELGSSVFRFGVEPLASDENEPTGADARAHGGLELIRPAS